MRPRPRNVICFGDMTFDCGEMSSYAFLREQIRPLEAAGIRVVLGMGNHEDQDGERLVFPCEPNAQRQSSVSLFRSLANIAEVVVYLRLMTAVSCQNIKERFDYD